MPTLKRHNFTWNGDVISDTSRRGLGASRLLGRVVRSDKVGLRAGGGGGGGRLDSYIKVTGVIVVPQMKGLKFVVWYPLRY